MKEYLCRKYDWTNKTFSAIDWEAHKSAIGTFNSVVQVTVHKLIHGWLATQKRKSRERSSITPTCLLCDRVNDAQHMFCCPHEEVKAFRKMELCNLRTHLQRLMDTQASEAIIMGESGEGETDLVVYRSEIVMREVVHEAISAQDGIGWRYFRYGRLARSWKKVWSDEELTKGCGDISSKVAALMLNYGLAIRRKQNNIIHGTDGGVSKLEMYETEATITAAYEQIFPVSNPSHRWLFSRSQESKLKEPYAVQIAWLDGIQKLYPEQFKNLYIPMGRAMESYEDTERQKIPRVGNPC